MPITWQGHHENSAQPSSCQGAAAAIIYVRATLREPGLGKVRNFIVSPTFLIYKVGTQFPCFGLLYRLNETVCEERLHVTDDSYSVPLF